MDLDVGFNVLFFLLVKDALKYLVRLSKTNCSFKIFWIGIISIYELDLKFKRILLTEKFGLESQKFKLYNLNKKLWRILLIGKPQLQCLKNFAHWITWIRTSFNLIIESQKNFPLKKTWTKIILNNLTYWETWIRVFEEFCSLGNLYKI